MSEFTEMLPEDLRDNESLQDFKDVGGLAKSFIDTQKKIGSMVSIPGEDASKEALELFYTRLGRPEKADDYQVDLTEDLQQYFDEDGLKGVKTALHGLGLNGKQFEGAFNLLASELSTRDEAAVKEASEKIVQTEAQLKTEWGIHFDNKLGHMESAIDRFFNNGARDTIERIAATDPSVATALSAIGAAISEGGSSMGGEPAAKSPDELQEEINKHLYDAEGPYRNRRDPAHLKTVEHVSGLYKQLHDAQQ